jgi:cysteinyl-tRNA synthetase
MENNINIPKKNFVLQLFNSLEKGITKLNLQSGQTTNIYLCGPTVYDHIHIGNLRPVIIFDILHRLLLHLGIKVNYLQNITDIDDKIITKAQKERRSEKKISDHYTKVYFANLTCYNILFPTYSPRVTGSISQAQKFIGTLLEKGFAYLQKGEVLFRVEENQEYGKLSGQNLAKLKSGVREVVQLNKENNKDFVL